jgi:hypothetical protein
MDASTELAQVPNARLCFFAWDQRGQVPGKSRGPSESDQSAVDADGATGLIRFVLCRHTTAEIVPRLGDWRSPVQIRAPRLDESPANRGVSSC